MVASCGGNGSDVYLRVCRFGATVSDDSVRFAIYLPGKENVSIVGSFNEWTPKQMNHRADTFFYSIPRPATEYIYYQYVVDGSRRIADPYSSAVLDPEYDWELPRTSRVRTLPPYPSRETHGFVSVVNLLDAPVRNYEQEYHTPKPDNLSIYELCVRDFRVPNGEIGTLENVVRYVDYFVNLGVNAVELMPVAEFEGNNSWGYMPTFPFAIDKAYGSPSDLRRLVSSLHSKGIAVILDIVLNHVAPSSPLVQLYAYDDGSVRGDNPWCNVEHNFGNEEVHWGVDLNHESTHTQRLVDSLLVHYITQYDVDGFRLDFTKGFSNTWHDAQSDPWGSAYDKNRIKILARLLKNVRRVKPDVLMICEHLADEHEERELAQMGYMLWTDLSYAMQQSTMGYADGADASHLDYRTRGYQSPLALGYAESHDCERLMYKCLRWGKRSGAYSVADTTEALHRMAAAATILFSVPGPKMLWQNQENAYYHSINENGRLGQKPREVDWEKDKRVARLRKIYKKLLRLRTKDSIFRTKDYDTHLDGLFKYVILRSVDRSVIAIANFDTQTSDFHLPHSPSGEWIDALSGRSITTMANGKDVRIEPGCSMLLMTK